MNKLLSVIILVVGLLSSTTGIAVEKVVVVPLWKNPTGNAIAQDVLEEKTFSNKEGVGVSGTMINNGTVTFNPGRSDQNVPEGYYDGLGAVKGDANLISGNIRSGINIFGVNGTSIEASGTALPMHVLSGETFSNVSGVATGTMANVGIQYIYPFTFNQTITQGYHDGTGYVAGDLNLVPGNIKSGITIFGVTGDTNVVNTSDATASNTDIIEGKIAYSNGTKLTGTNPKQTLSENSVTLNEGYYDASSLDFIDSDLISVNIKNGINIFGITGAANTSDSASVSRTGQVKCYDDTIEIACPSMGEPFYGQDGQFQKGITTTPRFTDNANGTVTDNVTGLIWSTQANCIASIYPGYDNDGTLGDGKVTWQHALDFIVGVNNATYNCGDTSNGGSNQSDWRLPNIVEMLSLVDYSQGKPALPIGHPFGSITSAISYSYWSSTTLWSNGASARVVDYWDGIGSYISKTASMYVWAVRGGI